MKWFINLSTRIKLFLSFGLMVFFLLVVIGIAYNGLGKHEANMGRVMKDFSTLLGTWDEMKESQVFDAKQLAAFDEFIDRHDDTFKLMARLERTGGNETGVKHSLWQL